METNQTKTCKDCGETKPLEEFNKDSGYTGGRRARCKACEKKRRLKRRAEEESQGLPETKTCNGCRETKPLEEFNKGSGYTGGRRPKCRVCEKKLASERRAEEESQGLPETKTCTECRETKPLEEFYKSKCAKYGRKPECKACAKKLVSERRAEEESQGLPETKTCNGCRETKPLEEFYKNTNVVGGRHNKCKACWKKLASEKRAEEESQGLPETKTCNTCGEAKPLEEFYKNKQLEYGRWAMCKACAEKQRVEKLSSSKDQRVTVMIYRARRRAKQKGLEFNLTKEHLLSIWPVSDVCPVLGIKMEYGSKNPDNSPSLDRIDNDKGYVEGNVDVVSRRANVIKRDATPDELRRVADYCSRLQQGGGH